MQEVAVKTHLIIKDIHDEFHIDWCGKFMDARPLFVNDRPVFVLVSSAHRIELNTTDLPHIEEVAKSITVPRGRQARTQDQTRIYLKEENGNEKLMGIVTHTHVKKYAPMYDMVGYK